MAKFRKEKVVLVEWDDAATLSNWHGSKLERANHWIYTAGVLVEKNKKHVCVALSVQPSENEQSDVIRIPMGAVRKIKTIGTFEVRE